MSKLEKYVFDNVKNDSSNLISFAMLADMICLR